MPWLGWLIMFIVGVAALVLQSRQTARQCTRKYLGRELLMMTDAEWNIIVELAATGEQESPWAWSETWPKGVDGDMARAALAKFVAEVKAKKTGEQE
jgi:hypothetical protein